MSKILITGGAGYIGSKLTFSLLQDGHEITVIDNLMFGGESLLGCSTFDNFNFIHGDMTNVINEKIYRIQRYYYSATAIVGAPACDRNLFILMK